MEGTLPASVFALEKLETLDLSHNKLSGSVSEVPAGALSNLRKISLAGNQITGVVPLSLLTLQKLTSVDVSDNASQASRSRRCSRTWTGSRSTPSTWPITS